MNGSVFFSTFALIFVAEFFGKTVFATVLLATQNTPWATFIGVAGAFAVQSFVAVVFGSWLTLLPERTVHLGAAVLFLFFAFAMWRQTRSPDAGRRPPTVARGFWRTAWSAFLVIFIAEWGDLTQLATAALAAKHQDAPTIFVSATLALWSVSALAVIVGYRARALIRPLILQRIAAATFAGVGGYFLLKALL